MVHVLRFLLVPLLVHGCSNFAMDDAFKLSVRTEDLGEIPYEFVMVSTPRGAAALGGNGTSRHGYVAFTRMEDPISLNATQGIKAGMNDAGLTCDKQTLIGSVYPPPSRLVQNIDIALLCRWALEGFKSVPELQAGLSAVNFVDPVDPGFLESHWLIRDASGTGLILECLPHRYSCSNSRPHPHRFSSLSLPHSPSS
eukprot:TRINITY_DN5748_c0_g1_i6.p1 TRINITY_DN5748_c0_g1~~TRINITY_DN5748_c0_g1_i6.p1  ORF type:complete len:197 (-),score=33.30 TRINITY_DN5748_c0_g1_i6:876-1466(-)